MVQFETPCEWLVDGKCCHYELRPEICREYDPAECERYHSVPAHKVLLRDERDLERYLADREERAKRRRKKRESPRRG
jgi:Fe-S-cluster containining protein